jgi:hypothetical protein
MPNATFTAVFAGTTVNIDASGNTHMTGGSASTLTMTYNGTTIHIDSSGNLTFTMAGGAKFDILSAGGSSSDSLALVSALVSWLITHTHSGVQTGGGDTGVPVQVLTDAEISSAILSIQD